MDPGERVKGVIEGKRYSGSRERCSKKEKGMATTTQSETGRKYGEKCSWGSC